MSVQTTPSTPGKKRDRYASTVLENGHIQIRFLDGTTLLIDPSKVQGDVAKWLLCKAIANDLGIASKEANSPEAIKLAMQARYEELQSGEFSTERSVSQNAPLYCETYMLYRRFTALQANQPDPHISKEQASFELSKMTEDQFTELKQMDIWVIAYKKIKADKAAAQSASLEAKLLAMSASHP